MAAFLQQPLHPGGDWPERDQESGDSELEPWTPQSPAVAGVVASGRMGRRALAAMALLGAAAVVAVAAVSLRGSPDSVEVHGGEPLSPLEMEEIDAELQELQATTAEAASLGQTDVTAFRTWSDKKNCLPNEELFMGLCYKKCSLLTGGTHPYRSSGWGCCEHKKCGLRSIKVSAGICSGFSVSGDGRSCPRQMGYCLDDEELFLGLCYKKCDILTDGTYPFRVTPVTCCRTKGLQCLHPSLSKWSLEHFDAGNITGNEAAHGNVSFDFAHPPLTIVTTYTTTITSTSTATTTTSTTSTSETTTTFTIPPETTTAVAATTVAETTTTVAATTVPETTVPETTVAETTVAETTTTVAETTTTVAETTVAETTVAETTMAAAFG